MSYADSVQSGWIRMSSSALLEMLQASPYYHPGHSGGLPVIPAGTLNFAEVVSHAIIIR
jgi:hypothetical protein